MAKNPVTRDPSPTVSTETTMVEGLEVVSQAIQSDETDEQRTARQRRAAEELAGTPSQGPVNLPAPDSVGVFPVEEHVAEAVEPPRYEHLVKARRRLDGDVSTLGEGPLVDGCRYNVVVQMEGPDNYRPMYVTDAMTGERLPTNCTALEKRGEQWYGQMHSRVGGSVETHKGMDPIQLVIVPA